MLAACRVLVEHQIEKALFVSSLQEESGGGYVCIEEQKSTIIIMCFVINRVGVWVQECTGIRICIHLQNATLGLSALESNTKLFLAD